MAKYGTKEFWEERLAENLNQKDVYYNAMENIFKRGYFHFTKLDYIADKVHFLNMEIKECETKLKEFKEPKECE